MAEYGEEVGTVLARRYVDSFPEAYKEDFPARTGAVDLGRLEAIKGDEGIALSLYEQMDADRGEAVKAYVVLRAGYDCSAEALIEDLRPQLAAFKVPRSVELVPSIPRSASGKALRRLLR